MDPLTHHVATYGLPLVFAVVLLEQLGLPIPGLPVLVVAGALAMDEGPPAWQVLVVAVLASGLADSAWFAIGRAQGRRVLATLCRVSLSPDSCVRQTESIFERWGLRSLLVAKAIPGFSTVAPALAGSMRVGWAAFLLFDLGGALLWAGTGVAGGMLFHRAIDRVLALFASIGSGAFALLAFALVAFIALKWWQRQRLYRVLRMARISIEELRRLMDEGRDPIVLDVRNAASRSGDPRRIPGATVFEFEELDARVKELPTGREIVLYCT